MLFTIPFIKYCEPVDGPHYTTEAVISAVISKWVFFRKDKTKLLVSTQSTNQNLSYFLKKQHPEKSVFSYLQISMLLGSFTYNETC